MIDLLVLEKKDSLGNCTIADKVDLPIISVKGDVNIKEGVIFRNFVYDYIEKKNTNFAIHMDVSTVGSTVISSLIEIYKVCKDKNLQFIVTYPKEKENMYEPLNLCGISDLITTYPI